MRKWKKLITVALVAVTTLSLAACGSKEESSEGKDSAEKKDGYKSEQLTTHWRQSSV